MSQLLINIPRKQAFVYAVFLVLYEFLTYIANDMIMPGMINVVSGFNGPESAIATSLTVYVLGGASLQLFLGPISDRHGRRPVMLFGALFFFICTILIACSNSIRQFLTARYFQGMGLCFINVIGYATLQEIFAEMDAIRLIAIMANISILAPLVGPLLGAIFIYYFSWRMIFVVIGALSLVALWGLWRFMPEPIGQTKTDGTVIKQTSLSFSVVMANYKKLLKNPSVILGSIALGLMSMPCVAWIALAPIIMVTQAKLTVIQYSLWQLPVFSACILGNIFLHHMTHSSTVKKLIIMGSLIGGGGLVLMFLIPWAFSDYFLWLMPGLIIYFFGLGMIGAPLSRFILFSTPVSKGTTSALMTLITMCINGGGIELANYLYRGHSNLIYGFYCAVVALIYFGVMWGGVLLPKK